MPERKIMIVGLGDLGGHVLEQLVRIPGMCRIIAADINEDHAKRKVNGVIMGAFQLGYFPKVEFRRIDVNDVGGTAKILRELAPDIIYNSVTLMSWWVITTIPKELYAKLDEARYGPWLPMHLAPARKLMQAVKQSGIRTHVLNAAFPDAVNPVLGRVGLAPTTGIGNIDNLGACMRKAVAERLGIPYGDLFIYMFGHHFATYYAARFGNTGGAPYFLKIMLGDRDITKELPPEEILAEVPRRAGRLSGAATHPLTAASVVKHLLAILNDRKQPMLSPGPNGLSGGYTISLGGEGAELLLPEEITPEEAIKINQEGEKFEGIEEIGEDGTVIFTKKSSGIMKELLGYDCTEMKLAECDERAEELGSLYQKFIERNRV